MDKKYYTEVKKDILPSQSSISIEKWTDWRKLNYDFYKKFDYNGKKVVNLGAGKGYFRELFKDSDYLTVDFYPYEGIDVVVDLIQPLPFDSNHYDFIILSNVLEHISEPEKLIKECYRILKNGGSLLITVPFFIKLHQQPYDFFRYTEYALKNLLSVFEEVDIKKSGTLSDIYKNILKDMFGLKNRLYKPIYLIVRFLTNFKIDHRNYPWGYEIIARK